MESPQKYQQIRIHIALCIVLLLTVCGLIYAPGTNGDFILDDQPNLKELAEVKEAPSIRNKLMFTLEGISSNLGRPISLATFAVQAEAWPNPKPFKYVNIFIHLCNGILVFFLISKILSTQRLRQNDIYLVALFATAMWLLHPIQTSTTLYVIQRMAQLSAFFVLLGLIFFIHGRLKLSQNPKKKSAYSWMIIGICACTPLAILSKENGILLPLYILAIEFTLFSHTHRTRALHILLTLLCASPLLVLAIYFWTNLDGYHSQYGNRAFTMYERLITEPRVLIDYLKIIFIPTPTDFGLYHDAYPASKNLTSPPATLFSIVLLLTLFIISIIYRKKYPLASFGVLFFLAAHALESTFLPLELYFEHRNYLAIIGPVLVTCAVLLFLRERLTDTHLKKMFIPTSGILISLLLSANTHHQVDLWSKPFISTFVWEQERPDSKRAKYDAASILAQQGQYEEAYLYYQKLQKMTPKDLGPYLGMLTLNCHTTSVPDYDLNHMIDIASHSHYTMFPYSALNKIVFDKTSGNCPHIPDADIERLLDTFTKNAAYKHDWHAFYQFRGMLSANNTDYASAAQFAEKGFSLKPDIRIGLHQVRWLYLDNQPHSALTVLNKIRQVNEQNKRTGHFWLERINEWEQFLTDHLNNEQSAASIPTTTDN